MSSIYDRPVGKRVYERPISMEGVTDLLTPNVLNKWESMDQGHWHKDIEIPIGAVSTFLTGATGVAPIPGKSLGGFNLDAVTEHLYGNKIISSDYMVAHDPYMWIIFETDLDNGAGRNTDKVQFKLDLGLKTHFQTGQRTKVWNLKKDYTIGKARKYTFCGLQIEIPSEKPGVEIFPMSVMSFDLSFIPGNSAITDVIVNTLVFGYTTQQVHPLHVCVE